MKSIALLFAAAAMLVPMQAQSYESGRWEIRRVGYHQDGGLLGDPVRVLVAAPDRPDVGRSGAGPAALEERRPEALGIVVARHPRKLASSRALR